MGPPTFRRWDLVNPFAPTDLPLGICVFFFFSPRLEVLLWPIEGSPKGGRVERKIPGRETIFSWSVGLGPGEQVVAIVAATGVELGYADTKRRWVGVNSSHSCGFPDPATSGPGPLVRHSVA